MLSQSDPATSTLPYCPPLVMDMIKGLATARPTLHIGQRTHAGRVEIPPGTQYFFKERESEKRPHDDSAADHEKPKPQLDYQGRIDKIITFD